MNIKAKFIMSATFAGAMLSASSNAHAQQVVELPSIGAMMEQSANGGTIQQAEQVVKDMPPVVPFQKAKKQKKSRSKSSDFFDTYSDQEESEKAVSKANKAIAEEQEKRKKAYERLLRAAGKKQKAYKPLKKVRFLPPDSTSY
jgi:DNA integrity scanning protein DisA with diadenylate cyclase activity